MLCAGVIMCGIAAALGLFTREGWAAANGKLRTAQGLYEEPLRVEASYNKDEVKSLNFDISSSNLVIGEGAGEEFVLTYYENFENQYEVRTEGGVLSLAKNKNPDRQGIFKAFYADMDWVLGFFDGWENLYNIELQVPAGFEFDKVDLKTSSGRINIDNIKAAGDIGIRITSGNVFINTVTAANIKVDSTSGKVDMKNVSAGSITAGLTSGNLYITDSTVNAGSLTFNCTSGKATLTKVAAPELDAKLTSGNLWVSGCMIEASVLKLTSGKAVFKDLPEGIVSSAVSFDVKVSSGNIKIDGERKGEHYSTAPAGAAISIKAELSSGNFIFN